MGAIYGRRIKKGEIILDQVPNIWRQATEAWLRQNP